MALILYGIKSCDTMKKARLWLDAQGLTYQFHDYKTQGIDRPRLQRWAKAAGWEVLLNKAGTTFRALPEAEKLKLDEAKAIALMLANPSMIKRPVLQGAGALIVGFNAERWAERLGRQTRP
jgi:arsenate reductase